MRSSTFELGLSNSERKRENRGKGKSIHLFCCRELKTEGLSFVFEFSCIFNNFGCILDCEVTSFSLHPMPRGLYYFSF